MKRLSLTEEDIEKEEEKTAQLVRLNKSAKISQGRNNIICKTTR